MQKEVFDTETGVPMEYTCLLRKVGVYVSATHNKVHSQLSLSWKLLLIDQTVSHIKCQPIKLLVLEQSSNTNFDLNTYAKTRLIACLSYLCLLYPKR